MLAISKQIGEVALPDTEGSSKLLRACRGNAWRLWDKDILYDFSGRIPQSIELQKVTCTDKNDTDENCFP